MQRSILLTLLTLFSSALIAQVNYEPLNYSIRAFNEAAYTKSYLDSNSRHSSFYPNIYVDKHPDGQYYRNYIPLNAKDSAFLLNKKYKDRSWLHRKVLKENFIIIDTGLLYVTIDPLFNFSIGREEYERLRPSTTVGDPAIYDRIYTNTRGLNVRADIGQKISLETYVYENQAVLPFYVDSFVEERDVVPGQGRVKEFKEEGYDYSMAGAYFSYAPGKNFNLQFGHHKHFIGDGYRSLMLSDNSFNYPFLRLNAWFLKNRISYSVMYTSFQNLQRVPIASASEAPFRRKGGSFHNIDVFLTNWLKINLFQGMIWRTQDENGKSDIDYNMFNPIIFINPALQGLEDENLTVLGMGFKVNTGKRINVYGQFIAQNTEFGYQLGTSWLPKKNIRLMAEFNRVEPYTYTHDSDTNQSYMHYNQALAHPLESGFDELILKVDYRFRRLIVTSQLQIASFEKYGQYINERNNVTIIVPSNHQGSTNLYRENQANMTFELAYLVNPSMNLKLFVNFTNRFVDYGYDSSINGQPFITINNQFIYFGMRTDLRNIYYDF